MIKPEETFELSPQVVSSRYFFRPQAPAASRPARVAPVYGGVEECAPDYWNRRESFAFPTIEFVVGGRGSLRLDDREWPLRPGSVFAYGPANRLEIRCDAGQPLVKCFVCLRGAEAERLLAENRLAPGQCRQALSPFPLQRVVDDLIEEGRSFRPAADAICACLVEALLLKVGDLPEGDPLARGAAETTFLRCRALIDREAARLGSLEEIARGAGVESAHLCRLFRRFQGQSPYQYLLRQKMTLAAERLAQTECLVKEAAEQVGMSDPYHFSRLFKKILHVAPSDFRRAVRRG